MGCAYCDKKLAIVFVAFFMLRGEQSISKKWDSALLAENFREFRLTQPYDYNGERAGLHNPGI
jgi:hypothetical protein